MERCVATLLVAAMVIACLSGCGTVSGDGTATQAGSAVIDNKDMFTDRDLSGEYQDAVAVTLGSGSFTITEEGTYLFTGSLTDGSITVDVSDENAKVQIVLGGVDIHCENGAPICVLNGDKVFLTLAEGTNNTLSCGESLEAVGDYQINAAVYSHSDLTVNGSGALQITSPGGHGISCKDDLVITGGQITITCASHGLDANDSVRIGGGEITVESGKDGIHSENTDDESLGFVYIGGGSLHFTAEGDGISAGSTLQIDGGEFEILCGGGYENSTKTHSDGYGQMPGGGFGGGHGGKDRATDSTTTTQTDESSSMKGIKAVGDITVLAGNFRIDAADDAIHSHGNITISGGSFAIDSGDDGVHAEDTLTVNSCTMDITNCYEGLEAVYVFLQGGEITINAEDDGLNAAGGTDASGTTGGRDGMFGGPMGGSYGSIEISGGSLTICSNGDGLDSNGDLLISGGSVYVTNSKSGDVSVLDSQNTPVITGGTYIGLGVSTMMAQSFSSKDSTQGVIACTCNIGAGTKISVADSDGNVVLEVTTECSTALMILSSPDIVKGESYTITAGEITGTMKAS